MNKFGYELSSLQFIATSRFKQHIQNFTCDDFTEYCMSLQVLQYQSVVTECIGWGGSQVCSWGLKVADRYSNKYLTQ